MTGAVAHDVELPVRRVLTEALHQKGEPERQPLVRELCAQVPKVLDVDPTNRAATVSWGAGAKHSLWRDSLFALTFETSMPDADVALREAAVLGVGLALVLQVSRKR